MNMKFKIAEVVVICLAFALLGTFGGWPAAGVGALWAIWSWRMGVMETMAIQEKLDNEMEQVCAEAYQVVGSMLEDLGQFNTELGTKILDNLSQARIVHDDVLPWPSFKPVKGEA